MSNKAVPFPTDEERANNYIATLEQKLRERGGELDQWKQCAEHLANELKQYGAGYLNPALKQFNELNKPN